MLLLVVCFGLCCNLFIDNNILICNHSAQSKNSVFPIWSIFLLSVQFLSGTGQIILVFLHVIQLETLFYVLVFDVLVFDFFVLLAPYVCYHILVKFR